MRKVVAGLLTSAAILVAGPVVAADLYVPPAPPPVDNGLGGSFYLRASIGGNALWTNNHVFADAGVGGATSDTPTAAGYGYSYGVGVGYEAGNGLRADVTLDEIDNNGLTDGIDTLHLRSTLALANAYYDFGLGGWGDGGLGAYVGAGLGGGYYTVSSPGTDPQPDGSGWTPAAAAMAGVTYDMGNVVADLGYRLIYMPQLSNNQTFASGHNSYYLNDNFVNELRATLRYRIN
jgi:hypothetical protein